MFSGAILFPGTRRSECLRQDLRPEEGDGGIRKDVLRGSEPSFVTTVSALGYEDIIDDDVYG